MRVAIIRREPKVALSMDVYADNLVSELKAIHPEWEIIQISPQPWSEYLENPWNAGNPLRKYYERFFNHPRAVSKIEADVFHIIDHTNGHVAYWLKKLGKPIIITCHDLVQYIYPEILKNQSRLPALSMAVWQYSVKGMIFADKTIAVSTNTATDISNCLNVNPNQITVIPNGVESDFRVLPSEIREKWRSQYVNSSEEICLLNVGSNHERKNLITILKVVKMISDMNISIRLWKIGDDFTTEQKNFIQTYALEQYIIFLGKPDRKALICFYNAANMVLAPSLYEGFGLTILEAMACGTPVITSNVSSLPEVCGNTALLIDPMDTKGIVNAILQIHHSRMFRQKLIKHGLERIKLFTWKKTAEKTASIYEQAISYKQTNNNDYL